MTRSHHVILLLRSLVILSEAKNLSGTNNPNKT